MRPQPRTGTPTQQELIERVEQPRLPPDAAPWNPPTAGTHNWLLLSDLEVLSLAAGIVLARTQEQARLCARTIEVD